VLLDLAMAINPLGLREILEDFITRSRDFKSNNRFKTNGGNAIPVQNIASEKFITLNLTHPLNYDASIKLKSLILRYAGNYLLELIVTRSGERERIRTTFRVNASQEFFQEIEKLFGSGTVQVI
jgi:hypothetical protein